MYDLDANLLLTGIAICLQYSVCTYSVQKFLFGLNAGVYSPHLQRVLLTSTPWRFIQVLFLYHLCCSGHQMKSSLKMISHNTVATCLRNI